MKIQKSTLILGLFAMVTACLPANINNINVKSSEKSGNNQLLGSPKSNPYYGEIDLKIDTSLANVNKENPRQFSLTKDENTFSTQSFKLPELVFSKIIKFDGQEKNINESFNAIDISKKYVMLVLKTRIDDNITGLVA